MPRKFVRFMAWFALLTLIGMIALIGLVWYMDRTARQRAAAFCDGIAPGTNISVTTAKAEAQGIFFQSGDWYTFYFPITLFDRALCNVAVDANGIVTSRSSSVQYD